MALRRGPASPVQLTAFASLSLAVSGRCPVHGCSGTLRVFRMEDSYEGIDVTAICSSHDRYHAFEFNDSSYESVGTKITPKPIKTIDK